MDCDLYRSGTGSHRAAAAYDAAMRVDEAKQRLRSMLSDASRREETSNARAAQSEATQAQTIWEVFKTFAAIPVEGLPAGDADADMLLSEWQTSEWSGVDGLHLGWTLTRQFSINTPSGDYDHMEQLACQVLVLPPTPSIDDGGGLFFPTTHLHDFVRDVDDSALFDAVHGSPVVSCAIQQERV